MRKILVTSKRVLSALLTVLYHVSELYAFFCVREARVSERECPVSVSQLACVCALCLCGVWRAAARAAGFGASPHFFSYGPRGWG